MNMLSWLLYLSSVCQSIKEDVLTPILVFAFLGGVIGFIIFMVSKNSPYSFGDKENAEYFGNMARKTYKTCIWIFCLFLAISVGIPDSTTVRLIAASQYGEIIVKDPGSQEVLTKLKDRLIRELDSDKGK